MLDDTAAGASEADPTERVAVDDAPSSKETEPKEEEQSADETDDPGKSKRPTVSDGGVDGDGMDDGDGDGDVPPTKDEAPEKAAESFRFEGDTFEGHFSRIPDSPHSLQFSPRPKDVDAEKTEALINGLVGALRAEYIDGVENGVGNFLDQHQGNAFLEAKFNDDMESQVREAEDKEAAIQAVETSLRAAISPEPDSGKRDSSFEMVKALVNKGNTRDPDDEALDILKHVARRPTPNGEMSVLRVLRGLSVEDLVELNLTDVEIESEFIVACAQSGTYGQGWVGYVLKVCIGKLWTARSQLYQRRFLQQNA